MAGLLNAQPYGGMLGGPQMGLLNQQEARSYDPSWRDRLARVLLGFGMPERSVESLMGSRGIGMTDKNMGMGLVDMTPLGAPLWLNEAERARGAGDMGGQMLNTIAAVPVPGAKVAAKALGEGAEAVQKGIKAYHGSPHDFDRFDMSKIGTGEGEQAFGHGLYFAENPGTAEYYRNYISHIGTDWDDPKLVAQFLADKFGSREAAIANTRIYPQTDWATREAIDLLRNGLDLSTRKGRMYETRINASPDEFLDWDKPLSEQPAIMARLGWTPEKVAEYKRLMALHDNDLMAQLTNDGPVSTPAAAREAYEKARAMVREIGFSPDQKGEAIARGGSVFDSAADAGKADKLRAAGIKGIRYLDQGSRGKGEGTKNYVVFSDDILEIIRKYGIAGLTGGALASAAGGEAKAGQ